MNARNFIVKRTEWARGRPGSTLFDEDTGIRCCLGFYANQIAHLPDSLIQGLGFANELEPEHFNAEHWQGIVFASTNTRVADCASVIGLKIIRTNDASDINDTAREIQLQFLFAAIGVTVEFVD